MGYRNSTYEFILGCRVICGNKYSWYNVFNSRYKNINISTSVISHSPHWASSIFLNFFRKFDTGSLNKTGSNLSLLLMRGICPNPEKNMLMQVCFWLNSSDICVWFLLEDATWNFLLWVTFTGGFFETRETRKFIRICSQSLYVCKAAVTLTERFSTNSFAYFRLRNAAKIIE